MEAEIDIKKSINGASLLRVELREGRNRQIRIVSEMLGHRVLDLQRISISSVKLNGLREGCWREVTNREREFLIKYKKNMNI